jgi:HEAT repeat protein
MRRSAAQWLEQLGDPDERRAHRARLKLGGLQSNDAWMIDGLLNAVEDEDADRRFWAIIGMTCLARKGSIGKAAAMRLAEVANRDRVFGIRQAAVGALGHCRAFARDIVPVIVRILRTDRSPYVRQEAVRALMALGRAAGSASPALVSALMDRDADVRRYASIALKFVPVSPLDGKAILHAASEHPDPDVRSQLRVVVRRLSPRVKGA